MIETIQLWAFYFGVLSLLDGREHRHDRRPTDGPKGE